MTPGMAFKRLDPMSACDKSSSDQQSSDPKFYSRPLPNSMPEIEGPDHAAMDMFALSHLKNAPPDMSESAMRKLIEQAAIFSPEATASGPFNPARWASNDWRLSLTEFHDVLGPALRYEEPLLEFNILELLTRCIVLFRDLQQELDENFRQSFQYGYMPDDTLIPNITWLVLKMVKEKEEAPEPSEESTPSPQSSPHDSLDGEDGLDVPIQQGRETIDPSGDILDRCAKIMRKFLEKNGDRACRELKMFGSNPDIVGAVEAKDTMNPEIRSAMLGTPMVEGGLR